MASSFAFRIYGVLLFLVFEIVSTAGESRAGETLPWSTYVTNCVDALIEHGRDQYGPIRSDMLMSIIDVDTLKSPPKPLWLDSEMYYEGRAHQIPISPYQFPFQ